MLTQIFPLLLQSPWTIWKHLVSVCRLPTPPPSIFYDFFFSSVLLSVAVTAQSSKHFSCSKKHQSCQTERRRRSSAEVSLLNKAAAVGEGFIIFMILFGRKQTWHECKYYYFTSWCGHVSVVIKMRYTTEPKGGRRQHEAERVRGPDCRQPSETCLKVWLQFLLMQTF